MKHYRLTHCLLRTLCLLLLLTSQLNHAEEELKWSIHQVDKLELDERGVYLDRPTIGGAVITEESAFVLQASKFDRMILVLEGESTIGINSEEADITNGDVIFLRANERLEFSKPLKIMLWESKSSKTNHANRTEIFSKKQIESERDTSENTWNPFIETSTMVAGLYMLPASQDGDDTLLHEMDEINYVLNGTAKFSMDGEVVEVQPGSIMWVKRGVGHYFYDLSEDFDVFILFETINMSHEH